MAAWRGVATSTGSGNRTRGPTRITAPLSLTTPSPGHFDEDAPGPCVDFASWGALLRPVLDAVADCNSRYVSPVLERPANNAPAFQSCVGGCSLRCSCWPRRNQRMRSRSARQRIWERWINSPELDDMPLLSGDGLRAFFASSRIGGVGGRDIWMIERPTTSDPFGAPVNLSAIINQGDEDDLGTESTDGLRLYSGPATKTYRRARLAPGEAHAPTVAASRSTRFR